MKDAKPIVIYGNGKMAELVIHAFGDDPRYRFCAVAADSGYLASASFAGLPTVPFELLEDRYPPAEVDLLVAVGYARMRDRHRMFERAKDSGYRLASCIGRGARIYPDLVVEENVIIFDSAYVGPGVRLGSNTIIRPQSYIGHDGTLEADVVVSPSVTIGGKCHIGSLSFLGIGATILDGIAVAEECLIGAGALVVKDTLPYGCYLGHPARRVKEVEKTGVVLGA